MGPQLKVVERSRTATMLCAASGNPDPEITWFKDFLPVNTSNNNGRIKQLRSGGTPIRASTAIELSEESDQGKYECVATNHDGTRYSTPANLYVRVRRVPPRFSIPPADSEIMPGGNVNITCVAVGSPMPYVKWMLGAEDLTPEDDMPIGRNVLELTDVRQSNNYTCVAMSTLGVIEAVAQISSVSYYVIQHRAKGSDDPYKEIDGVATTRYSVGGLSPYSLYDFRVAAVNTIGKGPSSDLVEARTAEQAPSSPPRLVRGRMLSTTTAIIHWDEPEEANGQVVGYRVYYTSDNTLPWEKQIVRSSNFITIQSLTPNKTYYIRVLGFTSVGDGPLSQDLQIIAKTGGGGQGGPDNQITGYELVYRRSDHPDENKVSFQPAASYMMRNLKPYSNYTFQLAARSKHGVGAYTNELAINTPQTLPSAPPQEVVCTGSSSTSVLVSWAPPPEEFHNGLITGYTVQYAAGDGNRTSVRVEGVPAPAYLLEGLRKWTEYGVTVRALTEAGEGPESLQLLVRTEEDVPSGPPRGVEAEAVNASAIRVKWSAPAHDLQHGRIRGYQVHYVRMSHGEPQGQPSAKDILMDDSQEVLLGDLKADTSYSVSWQPPPDPPTPLLGYRLTLGRTDVLPFTVVEFPPEERRYTAQDVHRGARYIFRLAARNKMGYGEEAVEEVATPEDRPGGYPEGVVARDNTASSVRLAWESVPLVEQNGHIVKYSVLYKDVNGRGNGSEVLVAASHSGALLRGLSADTVYDVRVLFATNFKVKAAMKTSVLLSWETGDKSPAPPFTILYGKGLLVDVDSRMTQKLIAGLEPSTQYSFLLTKKTNTSGSLQHRVTATTAPDILKTKPTLVSKTNTDGMVTVELPTVETTAKVRGYYVVVLPLKRQKGGSS
ncbi:hypothetical protein NHX12_017563 [Muraenolepis orangiensis]|uniref:protein-tyrosine-phosphatase n=1 Tax=Muraenolepis orangiensis TaxID=630683 RepID=A0A9Q0EV05_9TELE|nr:hypothetical protein NHX12_017563 [Muraenolepis orangiensis]